MSSSPRVGRTYSSRPLPDSNLPLEFDLRLPHLNFAQLSSGSNSVTNERLVGGLFRNLEFVPSDEFQSLLHVTVRQTASLPDKFVSMTRKKFDSYKDDANRRYFAGSNGIKQHASVVPSPEDRPCESVTLHFYGPDPRRCFNTSTSVDMVGDIFVGVRDFSNGFHEDEYDFEMPIQQFDLLDIPRSDRVRSPITDRSLCIVAMNRISVPSVCTFEMKKPPTLFQEHVRNVSRHQMVFPGTNNAEGTNRFIRSFCRGPNCKHELSAMALCLYLNHIFASTDNYHGAPNVTQRTLLMIAQTMVQVLTRYSRCGFLFMYETGVAFELQQFNENGQIVVRTSPLYCCGNQRGMAAAMLALSEHALKKMSEDRDSFDRINQFSRLVTTTYEAHNDSTNRNSPESRTASTNRNQADDVQVEQTSSGPPGSADQRNAQSTKHRVSSTVESPPADQGSIGSDVESASSPSRKDSGDMLVGKAHAISDISANSEDVGTRCPEEDEYLFTHLFEHNGLVLGSGYSGMVFESSLQKLTVALKTWNGESEEGFLELRNEVNLYRFMTITCPTILGTVVPNVFLALNRIDSPPHDVFSVKHSDSVLESGLALATEYVRYQLCRDLAGVLWLVDQDSSKPLEDIDERVIHQSAIYGLRSLHHQRILHGDIVLRNLGVERPSGDEQSWKVLWIDFGKATFGFNVKKVRCNAEAYECSLLFPRVADVDEHYEAMKAN